MTGGGIMVVGIGLFCIINYLSSSKWPGFYFMLIGLTGILNLVGGSLKNGKYRLITEESEVIAEYPG